MKNISGKKGWPSIKDTKCIKCGYNDIIGIRIKHKGELQTYIISYRKYVHELADLEVADRCYVSRLRELGSGYRTKDPGVMKEIGNINRLRGYNKQRRIEHIEHIRELKRMIRRQNMLIHDLHIIINEIRIKYSGKKYTNYKYNLRLTTYSDGQMKFDATVCHPIQFVTTDELNKRFEPIRPHVSVTEIVSMAPADGTFKVMGMDNRP